ncbi:unnamed protein product [Closterium sp. Yama58-4]|nr:unnamed protein product [Closterium sp. Yama58-4]
MGYHHHPANFHLQPAAPSTPHTPPGLPAYLLRFILEPAPRPVFKSGKKRSTSCISNSQFEDSGVFAITIRPRRHPSSRFHPRPRPPPGLPLKLQRHNALVMCYHHHPTNFHLQPAAPSTPRPPPGLPAYLPRIILEPAPRHVFKPGNKRSTSCINISQFEDSGVRHHHSPPTPSIISLPSSPRPPPGLPLKLQRHNSLVVQPTLIKQGHKIERAIAAHEALLPIILEPAPRHVFKPGKKRSTSCINISQFEDSGVRHHHSPPTPSIISLPSTSPPPARPTSQTPEASLFKIITAHDQCCCTSLKIRHRHHPPSTPTNFQLASINQPPLAQRTGRSSEIIMIIMLNGFPTLQRFKLQRASEPALETQKLHPSASNNEHQGLEFRLRLLKPSTRDLQPVIFNDLQQADHHPKRRIYTSRGGSTAQTQIEGGSAPWRADQPLSADQLLGARVNSLARGSTPWRADQLLGARVNSLARGSTPWRAGQLLGARVNSLARGSTPWRAGQLLGVRINSLACGSTPWRADQLLGARINSLARGSTPWRAGQLLGVPVNSLACRSTFWRAGQLLGVRVNSLACGLILKAFNCSTSFKACNCSSSFKIKGGSAPWCGSTPWRADQLLGAQITSLARGSTPWRADQLLGARINSFTHGSTPWRAGQRLGMRVNSFVSTAAAVSRSSTAAAVLRWRADQLLGARVNSLARGSIPWRAGQFLGARVNSLARGSTPWRAGQLLGARINSLARGSTPWHADQLLGARINSLARGSTFGARVNSLACGSIPLSPRQQQFQGLQLQQQF